MECKDVGQNFESGIKHHNHNLYTIDQVKLPIVKVDKEYQLSFNYSNNWCVIM